MIAPNPITITTDDETQVFDRFNVYLSMATRLAGGYSGSVSVRLVPARVDADGCQHELMDRSSVLVIPDTAHCAQQAADTPEGRAVLAIATAIQTFISEKDF